MGCECSRSLLHRALYRRSDFPHRPPLHRPAVGAEPGSLRLPGPPLPSGAGALHQRRPAGAGAGQPPGAEPIRVCLQQPAKVYGPRWTHCNFGYYGYWSGYRGNRYGCNVCAYDRPISLERVCDGCSRWRPGWCADWFRDRSHSGDCDHRNKRSCCCQCHPYRCHDCNWDRDRYGCFGRRVYDQQRSNRQVL